MRTQIRSALSIYDVVAGVVLGIAHDGRTLAFLKSDYDSRGTLNGPFVEMPAESWPVLCYGADTTPELLEQYHMLARSIVPDPTKPMRDALTLIEAKLTALLCERGLDSTMPEFHRVKEARDLARNALSQ